MGGQQQLLYLYSSSSRACRRIKPFGAYFPDSIRITLTFQRYSNPRESGGNEHRVVVDHEHERAPTMAEEFKRVAEEKAREGGNFYRTEDIDLTEEFKRVTEEMEEFKRVAEEKARQGNNFHKTGDIDLTEEFRRVTKEMEEFKRVAEAKARQGFVSQMVEKKTEALDEAVIGETRFETVKERYKGSSSRSRNG